MESLPPNIGLLIWLCLLTLLPCIFAIINIIHSIQFWNLRTYQYINARKPEILMLYTVLVSISLFVITPIRCLSIYMDSLTESKPIIHNTWLTSFMIVDSIYSSIFCTLINIIAVRVWLLFYDHKFAIATVDRIWRKSINPSDNNFFLHYKTTLGSAQFWLKLVFAFWILILSVILLILMLSNWSTTSHKHMFFVLRVFLAVPVAIFIFTIYFKIKRINDQFHLRQEMQSLGKWVLFLTASSLATSVLIYNLSPLYIFDTIVYSFDVLFIVCSSYIQTKSVLKALIRDLKEIKRNASVSKHKITMLDILRDQVAFEAFMRHCVNELSVESLLFLVEVAQYKATLSKHQAPDPLSQFYSLNVQKVNLREILLDSRFEQRLSITQDCFPMDGRSNSTRRSIIDFVDSHSRSTGRSTGRSSSVASNPATSSARKEHKFRIFQQSILDRKWLPISWQVPPSNEKDSSHSLLPQTQIASKSMRNLNPSVQVIHADTVAPVESTEIAGLKGNEVNTSQRPRTTSDSYASHMMPHIAINLSEAISSSPESKSVTPTQLTPDSPQSKNTRRNFKDITLIKANNNRPRTPKTPRTPHCTVSAEWIKDFASFLFEKYIKDGSEHSVNISGGTRRFLTDLFSIKDHLLFFECIVAHSGGDKDRSECPAAAINQQLLINTYLYHIFDQAFDEIWSLLRQNAFLRFICTPGYDRLMKGKETNGTRLSRVLSDALHLQRQRSDIKDQKTSTTITTTGTTVSSDDHADEKTIAQ
eukprot:327997_1